MSTTGGGAVDIKVTITDTRIGLTPKGAQRGDYAPLGVRPIRVSVIVTLMSTTGGAAVDTYATLFRSPTVSTLKRAQRRDYAPLGVRPIRVSVIVTLMSTTGGGAVVWGLDDRAASGRRHQG